MRATLIRVCAAAVLAIVGGCCVRNMTVNILPAVGQKPAASQPTE
jgi:hypothetical protein